MKRLLKWVGIGFVVLLVVAGLTSKGQPAAEQATATARPSGGLGLREAEWSARSGWELMSLSTEGVCYLERRFGAKGPTLEQARVEMATVLPADAVRVRSYSPAGRPEAVVDLYRSEWLRKRFTTDVWIGGEPGEFIVLLKVFDGQVAAGIAACGNNP